VKIELGVTLLAGEAILQTHAITEGRPVSIRSVPGHAEWKDKGRKSFSRSWLVITLLLVCFAAWRDCHFLFQSSAATGVDGYYYFLQVETLRNEGHLYFPTNTALVLYLLTAVSYLTQDTILAIKIGAVLMHLLLALGVMALIAAITRNAWFGLCGLVITCFSGLHLYLISEFLSNLGALVFFVWAAWAIAKFVQKKRPVWLILSVSLLLAAIFSHRSMIGLIILNSSTISVAYLVMTASFKSHSKSLTLAIVLILFALPLLLAWQPFFALPLRLKEELLRIPRLPLRQVDLAERWMLVGFLVTTLLVLFRYRHVSLNNAAGLALVSMVLWGFALTLNPFLNHHTGVEGIVGRLGIISYLQVAIAVPILLSVLFEVSKTIFLIAALFFLALLALSCFAYFAPIPLSLRTRYLQDREILVRELPKLRDQLCEKPFIMARHGDEFLITAALRIPSRSTPPTEQQQCVYWLIYQPPTALAFAPGSIGIPKSEFLLIEDKSLRQILISLDPRQYRQLLAVNSHLRRPP
jgi:hypothetical protein